MSFWNWVFHSTQLTLGLYIFILAIVGILVFTAIRSTLRQPLCVDCLHDEVRKHTPYAYNGDAVCEPHYREREVADEAIYKCPKHGVALEKLQYEDVTIDTCKHGCVFLDADELAAIEEAARVTGQSTGQLLGLAIGIATS